MSTPRPLSTPSEERSWIRAVGLHAIVTLLLYGLTISVGFRAEYVLLSLVWTVITFAGPRSRRFANIALPFLVVGMLYDQILPHLFQYRPEPHVADLYNFEKRWFGFHSDGRVVILSEWFQKHTSPWLDIPTGFGYM